MESIFRFQELSILERAKVLFIDGNFITSIRYYEYKINLYLFKGHYIEVFYHHKKDLVEKIEPFNPRCSRIKFYLDQVKLPNYLTAD